MGCLDHKYLLQLRFCHYSVEFFQSFTESFSGMTFITDYLTAQTLGSHPRKKSLFKPLQMRIFLFTSSNFIIISLMSKFEIYCLINAMKYFNFIL